MTTHTLHIYATQKTKNSQQSVYLHVPVNIIDSAFPLSLNEMVLALGCSVYDTVQNYDNSRVQSLVPTLSRETCPTDQESSEL